jgi:hypothetical protein
MLREMGTRSSWSPVFFGVVRGLPAKLCITVQCLRQVVVQGDLKMVGPGQHSDRGPQYESGDVCRVTHLIHVMYVCLVSTCDGASVLVLRCYSRVLVQPEKGGWSKCDKNQTSKEMLNIQLYVCLRHCTKWRWQPCDGSHL